MLQTFYGCNSLSSVNPRLVTHIKRAESWVKSGVMLALRCVVSCCVCCSPGPWRDGSSGRCLRSPGAAGRARGAEGGASPPAGWRWVRPPATEGERRERRTRKTRNKVWEATRDHHTPGVTFMYACSSWSRRRLYNGIEQEIKRIRRTVVKSEFRFISGVWSVLCERGI